jgi:hypothetical protein
MITAAISTPALHIHAAMAVPAVGVLALHDILFGLTASVRAAVVL